MSDRPPGWRETTLGEIAEIQGGLAKGKKRGKGEAVTEVPYLRVANVQRGHLDLSVVKNIPATEEERRQYRLLPGDVLFNEGGDRDKLGRGWVWSGEVPGCIHQNHVFRARIRADALLPKLLSWYGNSVGQAYFAKHGSQTTNLASLNSSNLRALPVLIPPLPEQRRIVGEIESYFTRLDDAVDTLERVERNLKRYRASVLKAAVEGRLVPTEAALAKQEGRPYEPASVLLDRILTERRRLWSISGKKGKYQEPAPPDTTNLPALPEGWCWTTLEQLCSTVTDGDHLPPPQTDAGVPFLVIGNVRDGEVDLSDTRFVSSEYYSQLDVSRRPQPGDVLYTVTGSFGIPVLVRSEGEFCVQRHIAILRPLPLINGALLRRLLESRFVFLQASSIATGTAQRTVPLKGLRRIVVPLPPLSEQSRMQAATERHLSLTDAAYDSVRRGLSRCARVRQSVLKYAFEGRLVDQVPTEAGASVLLTRTESHPEPKTKKARV